MAVAHLQAAYALLALGAPDQALADLDSADTLIETIRLDPTRDDERLVRMASLSAPPEQEGDVEVLAAWVRIARAGALVRLGEREQARAEIERARPLVQGWLRRPLRKALDRVTAELDDAGSGGPAGSGGAGSGGAGSTGSREDRLDQAATLLDEGRTEESIREALLLLREVHDDERVAAATRQVLGAALASTGRVDEALEVLQLAYAGFRSIGDEVAQAAASPGLAWLLHQVGRDGEAVEILENALPAARAQGDPRLEWAVLSALGVARDMTGRTRGALVAFEEAAAAAERAGDPVAAADARHGEAVVRATRFADTPDESVEALSLLDAARAAYEIHEHPDRAAGCLHESAALLARLGSTSSAVARYESALAAYLALEPQQRDAGAWPDEVADCRASLAVLAEVAGGTPAPTGAFASGGHQMRHPARG